MKADEYLAELRPLMNHLVRFRNQDSVDLNGKRTMGSWSQPKRCYISTRQRRLRDIHGETIIASGTVYLSEVCPINVESEIELPDGEQPSIAAVETLRDEDGPLITVVHLR